METYWVIWTRCSFSIPSISQDVILRIALKEEARIKSNKAYVKSYMSTRAHGSKLCLNMICRPKCFEEEDKKEVPIQKNPNP